MEDDDAQFYSHSHGLGLGLASGPSSPRLKPTANSMAGLAAAAAASSSPGMKMVVPTPLHLPMLPGSSTTKKSLSPVGSPTRQNMGFRPSPPRIPGTQQPRHHSSPPAATLGSPSPTPRSRSPRTPSRERERSPPRSQTLPMSPRLSRLINVHRRLPSTRVRQVNSMDGIGT